MRREEEGGEERKGEWVGKRGGEGVEERSREGRGGQKGCTDTAQYVCLHTLRTNTLTTALDTNLTIKIVEREAAESPIQSLFTHSIPRKYLINDTYVSAAKELTS